MRGVGKEGAEVGVGEVVLLPAVEAPVEEQAEGSAGVSGYSRSRNVMLMVVVKKRGRRW
jgi:hypothetical protein